MRHGFWCALTLLLTASTAAAQFDSATVVGTVRDSSSAVVPGATVTLTSVDRGANEVDADGNQRVEHIVEWIAKRRREHHRAGWRGLVVVQHDLRKPLVIHDAVHVDRFGL